MKHRTKSRLSPLRLLTRVLLPLGLVSGASAATVTASPASTGISYNWGITLGGVDAGSVAGAVGQWSWEDAAVGVNVGWGHTSHWIAVTITEPAILQLDLTRNASVAIPAGGLYPVSNYFPSFTAWRNHDTDPGPADFLVEPNLSGNWHSYNNVGDVAWAEDLVYLDHFRNNGTQTSSSGSWELPAGNYTFVVGGLAPAAEGASRQGYLATFTTTAVPEPGSAVFLSLAGLAALRRRRRRGVA